MDTNTKQFLVRFFSAMGLYLVLTFVAKRSIDQIENSALQHLLALIPILPVLVAARILVVRIRALDEVQRAIITEAAVISIFVTALGTLAFGFMQDLLGYPSLSLSWVFPAICFAYGVAEFAVRRKYR